MLLREQIALALWWFLAIALLFDLLPRALPSRAALLPALALLGLVAWIALSLIWTESVERTFTELLRVLHYAALLAVTWALVGRTSWKPAAGGLAAGALGICGYAVLSRTAPSAFPPDPAQEFFHSDRLSHPFGYWNAVGAWAAMSLPMAIAWSAHARSELSRGVALAAAPVAGAAVYLSYSRGALIACAVGITVVLVLAPRRWRVSIHTAAALLATAAVVVAIRSFPEIAEGSGGDGGATVLLVLAAGGAASGWLAGRPRLPQPRPRLSGRIAARAALAAVLIAVLGLTVARGPDVASGVRESFAARAERAGSDPAARLTTFGGQRQALWSTALDAFVANPVWGIGPGTFEFWWSRHGEDPRLVRDAHSLYLETAAELGLIGFGLLLVLLVGLLRTAYRARSVPRAIEGRGAVVALIAAFVTFLVSASADWMWEMTAVTALALIGIAVAAAPTFTPRQTKKLSARVRVVMAAAAILAGAAQIPGIVATDRIRASQEVLGAGDLEQGMELAQQAIDAEPWAASAYAERGAARAAIGDVDGFRDDLADARAREPTNWRYPLLLAALEFEYGSRRRAASGYEEARALLPSLPASSKLILRALTKGRDPGRVAASLASGLIRQ